MITISRAKLKAFLILAIVITLPSLAPLAHGGTTYQRTLPTNTIFFDDFSETNSTNYYIKEQTGTLTGTVIGYNTTRSFDGTSSYNIYEPNANSHVSAVRSIVSQSDIIGFQAWMSFNYAMYITNDGQALELALNYWDFAAGGNNHRAMVEYRPALGQWVIFGNAAGPTGSNAPQILYTFPGVATSKDGLFAYNDQKNFVNNGNAWYWVKVVINTLSHKYVSVCTDTGCFANATNYFLGNTATGLNPVPEPNVFQVMMRITNDATQLNSNAMVSDLLITDETAGGPGVIQFGISLFSGWFPILVASIALLYTVSGLGLMRRVWFNQTQGIFTSYRTIVVTGMIATIGFIVILAIGALLTQQVCSGLPQGTATCSY